MPAGPVFNSENEQRTVYLYVITRRSAVAVPVGNTVGDYGCGPSIS